MAYRFADKMQDTNNTLIVDALNLAFRWKHTAKWNTFRYEFERTVDSLALSYDSTKVILAADQGSSTYRKELYPEYKGDRKEKYKDQSEEEKIKFEEFFEEFGKALELCSSSKVILRYQGVEADDVAAHLVVHAPEYKLDNIWLVSSDRDWSLLVRDGVSQFSWRTRKEITLANWDDHYDVEPYMYISQKCLEGDKGDNVPGITGIGPKRAADLIRQYGSAMDIYDMLPIDSNYAHIKNLNASGDLLLLNYELMDLVAFCDDAVGADNIVDIKRRLHDAWQ